MVRSFSRCLKIETLSPITEAVSPTSSRGQLSPTVPYNDNRLKTPERRIKPSVEESFREMSNALIDLEEREVASPLQSPMYPQSALSSLSPSSAFTNLDFSRSPGASVTPLTPFDYSTPFPRVNHSLSIPEFSYESGRDSPPVSPEEGSAPRYRPPTRLNPAVPRQDTWPAPSPPKLAIAVSDLDLRRGMRREVASPAVSRDPIHRFVPIVERRNSMTEPQTPWLEAKVPLSPVQKFKSFFRLGKPPRNNPWLEHHQRHSELFRADNNSHDETPGAPSPSTDRGVNRLGGRIQAD